MGQKVECWLPVLFEFGSKVPNETGQLWIKNSLTKSPQNLIWNLIVNDLYLKLTATSNQLPDILTQLTTQLCFANYNTDAANETT